MRESRLRDLRIASGLSAAEVGKWVDRSPQTIWAWERGEQIPDWAKEKLAKRFGVSIPHLMGWRT